MSYDNAQKLLGNMQASQAVATVFCYVMSQLELKDAGDLLSLKAMASILCWRNPRAPTLSYNVWAPLFGPQSLGA